MKNIANYLSISRAIMSIVLLIPETFSIAFYIIYVYCGISDMLDGFVARKSNNTSKLGARLDSTSDIIFFLVAMFKILPVADLSSGIVIWIIIITIIKTINMICSYIYHKKIFFLHTVANKITGLLLFILPLINANSLILQIIVCTAAIFSAIQEGHYIRKTSLKS